jgi:hypothetical protein
MIDYETDHLCCPTFHIFGLRLRIGGLAFLSDKVLPAWVGQGINKIAHLSEEAKMRSVKTDLSIYGKFDF